MNMSAEKLCRWGGQDSYDFRSIELEVDKVAQEFILSVWHNSKCEKCFYLEECIWKKIEEILLRTSWITFEWGISGERVLHSKLL